MNETTIEREERLKKTCEGNLRYDINQMVNIESDQTIIQKIMNRYSNSRCKKQPQEIQKIINEEKKFDTQRDENLFKSITKSGGFL
jgi:hypothetical protein